MPYGYIPFDGNTTAGDIRTALRDVPDRAWPELEANGISFTWNDDYPAPRRVFIEEGPLEQHAAEQAWLDRHRS